MRRIQVDREEFSPDRRTLGHPQTRRPSRQNGPYRRRPRHHRRDGRPRNRQTDAPTTRTRKVTFSKSKMSKLAVKMGIGVPIDDLQKLFDALLKSANYAAKFE